MQVMLNEIYATDIPDAWFQCIDALVADGFKYDIQHGSFANEQTRLELDHIVVCIDFPYNDPWDLMLPKIPPHLGIPDPVANGYVEEYMPYLMTSTEKEGEDYTYGERIEEQIWHWEKVLKKTPNTNQAVLQVARPSDSWLSDPPCLRHIDMRVKNEVLIFYPYFRSWDLWAGFPANLAGIVVLQRSMADNIGVKSGPIIASSKGLHVYGYAEELAKLRVGK